MRAATECESDREQSRRDDAVDRDGARLSRNLNLVAVLVSVNVSAHTRDS
jgi:hypothetical protein